MNTDSISLSGRTELPHAYVLTTSKSEQEGENVATPSARSLPRLQRGRLAAQEATDPYFKGDKTLIGQTVSDLKGEKVIPWRKISDAKLIFISQKALQIALKKFFREMEWERLYEYLKENFRKFYLKVIEEKEELKRFQIKDQIKSERSY